MLLIKILLKLNKKTKKISQKLDQITTENLKLDHMNELLSKKTDQIIQTQEKQILQILELLHRSSESLQKEIFEFKETTCEKNETIGRANRTEVNSILHKGFENISSKIEHFNNNHQRQLDSMRQVVDEKLQTTLEKKLEISFRQVSERLENVHKGLGEMQSLATGVGDLKKTLSNVKTRGILGEYQLGNILDQMLSPHQYSKNVSTKKGSLAHVEYAVKLPGHKDNEVVWIPIDSKFPLESYHRLTDALEKGDSTLIETTQKKIFQSIESFAKEINTKYLDPPYTTNFAIMFLPIESLYSEVLRDPKLFEKIQRNYQITITGPTTLSAFLNSLQMGYRTLSIQKKSNEVWKTLSKVKTEFIKFKDHLSKVDKQLHTAVKSLNVLQNTRTNTLNRALDNIETPYQEALDYHSNKADTQINQEESNFESKIAEEIS